MGGEPRTHHKSRGRRHDHGPLQEHAPGVSVSHSEEAVFLGVFMIDLMLHIVGWQKQTQEINYYCGTHGPWIALFDTCVTRVVYVH